MPRFYFDKFDGQRWTPDEAGSEAIDVDQALDMAQSALSDILRDEVPDGQALTIRIRIRDEAKQVVGESDLDMHTVKFGDGSG